MSNALLFSFVVWPVTRQLAPLLDATQAQWGLGEPAHGMRRGWGTGRQVVAMARGGPSGSVVSVRTGNQSRHFQLPFIPRNDNLQTCQTPVNMTLNRQTTYRTQRHVFSDTIVSEDHSA